MTKKFYQSSGAGARHHMRKRPLLSLFSGQEVREIIDGYHPGLCVSAFPGLLRGQP